jgi:enoyl-CoA hydratase
MRNNVLLEIKSGVAIVTLNRPQAMNALCRALNEELLSIFAELRAAEDVRVLILTGGAGVFAAGADIREMLDATPAEALRTAEMGHSVHDALENLPFPTIAAVSGAALGGGCELALACDFRIAGESAVFSLPEVGLGILPGAGGTQRLLPLVGLAATREMVLLGKRVKGAEAQSIGLVNRVTPDDGVMDAAMKMAERLLKMPAPALRLAKQAVNHSANYALREGKERESLLFSLAFSTEDQKEGLRAFSEKRTPHYTHNW